MERAFACLLFLFVVGILTAVFVRKARPVTTVLIAILIYVPSYFVWFALQYLNVVPVDSLLRRAFDIDSYQLVGTPLGALVMFGPPLLPSIIILGSFFLFRTRRPLA